MRVKRIKKGQINKLRRVAKMLNKKDKQDRPIIERKVREFFGELIIKSL